MDAGRRCRRFFSVIFDSSVAVTWLAFNASCVLSTYIYYYVVHSVRSELLLFPILYYVCGCGVRLEHLKMLRQPFVCLLHGARSLLDYFGEHIVNDMSTEFLVPFIVEARLI